MLLSPNAAPSVWLRDQYASLPRQPPRGNAGQTPAGRIRAWKRGRRSGPISTTCHRGWQHEIAAAAVAPLRLGYARPARHHGSGTTSVSTGRRSTYRNRNAVARNRATSLDATANSSRLGGRTKQFGTVAEAIVFIQDGLNLRERRAFLISTDAGTALVPIGGKSWKIHNSNDIQDT